MSTLALNEVEIVHTQELLGQEFKIYGNLENPLFLAKDVANWIEHSKVSMMLKSIDKDEKVKVNNVYSENRTGGSGTWCLTEDGLYEVLMQSKKPIAKQFKKKVKEILKSIRKDGGYIASNANDDDATIMAKGLLAAQRAIERKNKQLEDAKKIIQVQQPKVIFADSVSASEGTILVRELAKILKQNGVDTGEKRLYQWLRDNGYLIKRKGTDYNMPTQRSMELKLFEIKETAITRSDGINITKTPRVTGKGQIYFINKLKPITAFA